MAATATMPASHQGFSVIEQYRTLSKHVFVEGHDSGCNEMMALDQEVPQARSTMETGDFFNPAAVVKMEVLEPPQGPPPEYMCSFMENIFEPHHDSNSSIGSSNDPIPTATSASQPDFRQLFSSSSSSPSPTRKDFPHSNSRSSSSPQQFNMQPITSHHQQYSPLPSSSTSPAPSSSLPFSSSPVSSSPLSYCSSSSPSPLLSSTAYTVSPSPSSTRPSSLHSPAPTQQHQRLPDIPRNSNSPNGVRMSTYVTELGGSGCVVMTPAQQSQPPVAPNTDFLTGESFGALPGAMPNFLGEDTPPSLCVPEENLDYLDLDKQPVSFYDELELPQTAVVKSETSSHLAEGLRIEDVIMMRDVIYQDCDYLDVPYEITQWNLNHVRKWVSWVCQKNNLQDVSEMVAAVDGRTLWSFSPLEISTHYGRNAGSKIETELDLWRAANEANTLIAKCNVTPPPYPNAQMQSSAQAVTRVIQNYGSVARRTPSVSPAPSSASQDSNHLSSATTEGSSSSDNSDDEFNSSSDIKPLGYPKVGRGHKQTIHLWQFLRELLLSKENHDDCIRWLDRRAGIFKIEDSKKVAFLWGQRKNRPAMNYDKLSRSVRQYYKKKIIKKTEQSKRLVYQFCPGYL